MDLRMLGLMDVAKGAQLSPLVPFEAVDKLSFLAHIPKIDTHPDF